MIVVLVPVEISSRISGDIKQIFGKAELTQDNNHKLRLELIRTGYRGEIFVKKVLK
jgi:hypothetical protein